MNKKTSTILILCLLISLFLSGCLPKGSIMGTTFVDANQNGVMDANEVPLSGVKIGLFSVANTNTPLELFESDTYGSWGTDELEDGEYYLVYQLPTGELIRGENFSFNPNAIDGSKKVLEIQKGFPPESVGVVLLPPELSPSPSPGAVSPQIYEGKPGDRIVMGDVAFSSLEQAFIKYDNGANLYYLWFTLENLGATPLPFDVSLLSLKNDNGDCTLQPDAPGTDLGMNPIPLAGKTEISLAYTCVDKPNQFVYTQDDDAGFVHILRLQVSW